MLHGGSFARQFLRRRTAVLVAMLVAASPAGLAVDAGSAVAATHKRAAAPHRVVAVATYAPAAATGALGLDLLRQLGAGANTVLSPDSIATAVAMTGTGARGATAQQMAATLHVAAPSAFPGFGVLQSTIMAEQAAAGAGHPQPPQLDIANALFVQQSYPLESAFTTGLASSFGAAPQPVDFLDDPTAALQTINGWVSAQTDGIIPAILEQLDPATRLVLANALYLKAQWASQFSAQATSNAPFQTSGGDVTTAYMHQTSPYRYTKGSDYAAVDLPYAGSTLSLLVVLPVGSTVGRLQSALTEPMLARIVAHEKMTNVNLSLPRFQVSLQTDISQQLQALGMTDAFDANADFTGITTANPLQIGQVVHAANFTVQEQGTVAAAATVVTIVPTSATVVLGPTVQMNVDHPFLFFLRDDKTGAILFAGRIAQPVAPTSTF
jgi:serpin B